MCVSKSRQKPRPAQPRVERHLEPPELVGPIRTTGVRVRVCRGILLAPPRRPPAGSGYVPHARVVRAAPRRSLSAHPLRPEGPDRVQTYASVQVGLHYCRDAGRPIFTCEHTGENPPIRVGSPHPARWGTAGARRHGVGLRRGGAHSPRQASWLAWGRPERVGVRPQRIEFRQRGNRRMYGELAGSWWASCRP